MVGKGPAFIDPIRCLILAVAVISALPASAAELVMFRRAGCPWCDAWDRDIGAIYGKSEIGRRAPLRQVDLERDRPDVLLRSPIRFSPTFVLVENGHELGRIEGYPGEDFFWGLLEQAVNQLPSPTTSGLSARRTQASDERIHAPTGSQTPRP
jgi:hypothetical protein